MIPAQTGMLCLSTPCGGITVADENDNPVPFDLRHSGFLTAYEDGSGRVYNTPHKYIISVPAAALERGQRYCVRLTGTRLYMGDTDECYLSVAGSGNGFSIAIGAADPNEPEKYCQLIPSHDREGLLKAITAQVDFDRSSFTRYDLYALEDFSGFSFELLDDSCAEIVFPVAWIETGDKIIAETEDAVQFWVL